MAKNKRYNANGTYVNTPFGKLLLAKNDAKRFRKTVMELQRTTDSLTRKDIGDWRMAWQMAINIDNPNRQRLYDIYRDVEVDLHLSGCIQQREGFVLSRSFKLVNEKGEEDEQGKGTDPTNPIIKATTTELSKGLNGRNTSCTS